jgi:hypothetical protein
VVGRARRHLHVILRGGRSVPAHSLQLPPPGAFKIFDYDYPTPDATCALDICMSANKPTQCAGGWWSIERAEIGHWRGLRLRGVDLTSE